jgi:hypothetical protein
VEANDRRRALWIALALFAVLALGAFFALPGKSVAGAWRILQGEVPYRDWWTMYAPGEFCATALLLLASGKQVLAPALAACAVRAATGAVLYGFARRIGASARVSTTVALVLGASQFELSPELSSYPPAILLVLLALERVVRHTQGVGARNLPVAGALLGFAAFFKHDVAAYATAGAALGLAAAKWIAPQRPAEPRELLADVASLVGVAGAIVAVLATALALVAGRAALEDLILFPLGDFQIVRGEPYPGFVPRLDALRKWLDDRSQLAAARDVAEVFAEWILANAPQLAFVAALALVARARRVWRPEQLAAACVLLAAMPFFWWAAHTQQNTHFTTLAIASWLLGGLAWTTVSSSVARAGLLALGTFYGVGLAIRPASEIWQPLSVWSRPVALDLPATRGIFVSPREREVYRAIAEFVAAGTEPGEPIHYGVARHDAIVINNPRFLWLLDRPCATRYHELHPGVTDRDDVQREMLADLERKRVRCAVIWRFGWPEETLQRIVDRRKAAIGACGATELDEYFAANFRTVLEVGEYAVLWRDLERR